jgi:septal ring factor EnvC (AmiA/AmiB activator)
VLANPDRPTLCYFFLVTLLMAVLPAVVHSEPEEQEARGKLEQLQAQIKRTSREISTDNERKNSLQQELKTAEVELGRLQGEMAANERAIAASEEELLSLRQQRGELENARDTQQARIAVELKTAWQMGQQTQVKVLLNQESPHTVARAMAYYRYFFKARNELVVSYRETLQQLAELEQRIATTLKQLAEQQATLGEQQAQLVTAQATRAQAVAKLTDSIDSKAEQLKQMERNRKELEDLITAIEKAVVDLNVPDDYQPFKSAKGKMPWPLGGKRASNYGRPRNEGKMRWQGVTIPAKDGTQVTSIHHGRVVYADWLRGSGLLMIIDHGDGYMSLYAHNQSLLREVGEWVGAGTPISTVGNSGGQEKTALYFEIRHQGKPTNPGRWCKD